jgi:hypothetical protein
VTIINKKNITTSGFDADALSTTTDGETIINFGDLTTTGDLANGISASANNVLINNFGAIETFGLGAPGISVHGDNAHTDNFGLIVTHGGHYPPDTLHGFSDGMAVFGDRFYIANHGNIRNEDQAISAMFGLGAAGTIVNFGSVTSTSAFFGASVLFADGDGSQVINAGQIAMSGPFYSALNVQGLDTSASNNGQIRTTGVGGVGIHGSSGFATLTNKGAVIATGTDSGGILAFGDNNHIDNSGHIETNGSFTTGIVVRGGGSVLGLDNQIVNEGSIVTDGDVAIGVALGIRFNGFRPAADNVIDNRGVISTHGNGAAGVVMAGDGHHLTNSGRITADGGVFDTGFAVFHAAGVIVTGDDAQVENSKTGVIESKNADSAAVELNALTRAGLDNTTTHAELDNYGLIKGAAVAVLSGDGDDTVVNLGQIVGDVVLGNGADTFVSGKGSSLSGMLFLGGGDDFVDIEKGSGSMTIADFAAGPAPKDIIDISAFYSNLADLEAHSYQSGSDVVISLGNPDQLTLANVKLSTLDAGDFKFV